MQIDIERARKTFGKMEALRGVTTHIPSGRRCALVGPNGSGKSTLIRGILGLIDCDGRLLLDGRSPYENRVALAHRLAYVPQTAPQLGASVAEVLSLICTTRALELTAIARFAERFELDLGAIRRRPFKHLSGGMKQKLLLAVAFATSPSLLVLDEPTASLDARARETFSRLYAELRPEVTTLVCSHRLEELSHLATQVVALEEGLVVYDGPVAGYAAPTAVTRGVALRTTVEVDLAAPLAPEGA